MPALHAGREASRSSSKDGARDGGAHRIRVRTVLLFVQTILSVVLLVGAGLFVRSLHRIDALPLGLEPSRVLVANVATQGVQQTAAEVKQLYQRLLASMNDASEIQAAALATSLPFYTSWAVKVRIPGRDSIPRVHDGGPYISEVTPGYFATIGTRILRGRGFTESDQASSSRVTVINESMARIWWPNENAIGKCIQIGGDTMPCSEVVGIGRTYAGRRSSKRRVCSTSFRRPSP